LDGLVEDCLYEMQKLIKGMSGAIIIDCYLSLISSLREVRVAAASDLKMFNYFIAVNLIY
jgi:hypothetical protein